MKKIFTKKRIIILIVCLIVIVAYCFRCAAKAETQPEETPIAPFPFESYSPVSPAPSDSDIGDPPIFYSPPYNSQVAYRYYAVERGVQEGVYWYTDTKGNVGSVPPNWANASYSNGRISLFDTWGQKGAECSYDKGRYVFEYKYTYRNKITDVSDGDYLYFDFTFNDAYIGQGGSLAVYDSQTLDAIVAIPVIMNINISGFDDNGNPVTVHEFVESSSNTTSISCKCELRGISTVSNAHVQVSLYTYSGGGGSFRTSNFWYFVADNVTMQDSYHQGGVINTVKRLLVPDSNDLGIWLNDHTNTDWLGSFNTVWSSSVGLLQSISDYGYNYMGTAPKIQIPPLSLTVDGEKHTFFNGYTFDFSTLPSSLIQWVKTAVSIPLVCGFVGYCISKIYDFIDSRFLVATNEDGHKGGETVE